jgi:hypothetical protein
MHEARRRNESRRESPELGGRMELEFREGVLSINHVAQRCRRRYLTATGVIKQGPERVGRKTLERPDGELQ